MVLCKYFIDGEECPELQECPNDHLDIKQFVKTEMECAINGDQWPLSCFGPFTEKPSISNYIEDQSFEEVRMMYYSGSNQSFFDSCRIFSKALNEAKSKMRALLAMDTEVMNILGDIYDTPLNEKVAVKGNPFDFSSSFGEYSGGVFKFTAPGGGFVSGQDKSVLGKNTFGFGFGVQPPQANGFFNQPQSGGFFIPPQSQQVQQMPQRQQSEVSPPTVPPLAATSSCDECTETKESIKDVLGLVRDLLTEINENQTLLKKQEEEIKSITESLKNATVNEKITAVEPPQKEEAASKLTSKNVPPLMITPRCKQTSAKTKKYIKTSIDPFSLSAQINSISKSTGGSIIIKCNNKESLKMLETIVKEKFGADYNTKVLKLQSPRILVNGIDDDINEENLIETIRKQNHIKGEMKLIRCFEKVNSEYKYNAIIEVDKSLYQRLMGHNEPFLNIGWSKCYLFDSLNLKRCFNCWGLNHIARYCRSQTKCPKCGGEHMDTECKSRKLKCINCIRANVKLNMNLDVGHDSRNQNCHIYLKMLQKEREMIDY